MTTRLQSTADPATRKPRAPLNAFSVDVEEHYQVLNFQGRLPRSEWSTMESRVGRNTHVILDLLDEAGVKGTFFCLGCVAQEQPHLIREIARRGHEVASHGWSHTPITALSGDAFREEVSRSRGLLEDLAGSEVIGFRAPSFSVVEGTRWALDILAEEGYRYDSSVFPVRHPDYGIPGSPDAIHFEETPGGRHLLEFPMTVARFMGRGVPVSGGGYFRLLPFGLTRWGIRQVNACGRPAVFYLHPWEVDPDQPCLRGHTTRVGAFRHYTGLHRTTDRLRRLLSAFSFAPLRTVLEHQGYLT